MATRPKTADADTWTATHDADGQLNAEGFARGMSEVVNYQWLSMRIYLRDSAQGFGALQSKTYTILARDYHTEGASITMNFSTLKEARACWALLHKVARHWYT